jgi:hypothetical protein
MIKRILSIGVILGSFCLTNIKAFASPPRFDEIDLLEFIDEQLQDKTDLIENYELDEKGEYKFTHWIKIISIPLGTYDITSKADIDLDKYNTGGDDIEYSFSFTNANAIASVLRIHHPERFILYSNRKIKRDSWQLSALKKVKSIVRKERVVKSQTDVK